MKFDKLQRVIKNYLQLNACLMLFVTALPQLIAIWVSGHMHLDPGKRATSSYEKWLESGDAENILKGK